MHDDAYVGLDAGGVVARGVARNLNRETAKIAEAQ
jgi:hypothetical protein